MSKLRFYLDENVDPKVAEQLQRHDIDAVSVRDLGLLGDDDETHLKRATEMGRVLCTHDVDYIILAKSGLNHAGIIRSAHSESTLGGWVRQLVKIHATQTAEEMINQVRYVSTK